MAADTAMRDAIKPGRDTISVVIPLYNKERYISRALQSVFKQSHAPLEIIVVDDGSTDAGARIVEDCRDARVRLIRQANCGVSAARNRGAEESKGKWVLFLDADDEIMPHFLQSVVAFIAEHKRARLSMVGANYYIATALHKAVSEDLRSGVYDFFRLFRNHRSPSHTSTTVVLRDNFMAVEGFPVGVRQFEDWITWIKLAGIGEYGFIAEPLGVYHEVLGSVSRSKRDAFGLYSDACELPRAVDEHHPAERRSKFVFDEPRRVVNEFVIGVATALAAEEQRVLAVKLLRFVSWPSVFWSSPSGVFRLFGHLVCPAGLRRWLKSNRAKLHASPFQAKR